MDASPRNGDREVVAGGFDGEGVVKELVLYGIVVIESEEGVSSEHIRKAEEVEMERVIADDESVIGEGAEEHRLFRWYDAKCLLHRLDTCDQMRVGAGAANAREELRDRRDRLSFHRMRVEAFEFLDGELDFCHLSVFEEYIESRGAFHLGDFLDGKLTEFGYLMHRKGMVNGELRTGNGAEDGKGYEREMRGKERR